MLDILPDALLRPAAIGTAANLNRIVMPAMTGRTVDMDGYATADGMACCKAKSEGGVGLITVELPSPEKVGRHGKARTRHRQG